MSSAALIFVKEPQVGAVKTRLIQPGLLNAEDAARLAIAMLHDTAVAASLSGVDTVLYSIATTSRVVDTSAFTSLPDFDPDHYHLQAEGNFGDRMADAIRWALAEGYDHLIVLGADSPHIQPTTIRQTLELLAEFDVVLGPSAEGGIYLIGISAAMQRQHFPDLFSGIELVAFATECHRQQLSVKFLHELSDVDIPSDLVSLIAWIDALAATDVTGIYIPAATKDTIQQLGLQIKVDTDNTRSKRLVRIKD